MGSVYAIVGFLALILLVVIPIHELGHMLVARRFGFKVTEYFIGFGPRLWSRRRGEIEYGVKAIPAGGYVKIAGMNPYESVAPEDLPRAYGSKPIWQRALVILAGPRLALPAWEPSCTSCCSPRTGTSNTNVVVVGDVAPTLGGDVSPAKEAGLRVGDVVVRVGDLSNPTPDSLGPVRDPLRAGAPGRTPRVRGGARRTDRSRCRSCRSSSTEDGVTKGRIGFTLGPGAACRSRRRPSCRCRWVGRATWNSVAAIPKIFTAGRGSNVLGPVQRRTASRRRPDQPRRA